MANFEITYPIVTQNKGFFITTDGEDVYKGIGRKSNPTFPGWKFIDDVKNYYGTASSLWNRITTDITANNQVNADAKTLYKKEYWDKMRLTEINDQNIANLLFDFGTFRGVSFAVKSLQTILKLPINGIIDNNLITAINASASVKLYSEITAVYKSTVPLTAKISTATATKNEPIVAPESSGFSSKYIFGALALVGIGIVLYIKNKKKKS